MKRNPVSLRFVSAIALLSANAGPAQVALAPKPAPATGETVQLSAFEVKAPDAL